MMLRSNDVALAGNDVSPAVKFMSAFGTNYICVADSEICAKHIHHLRSKLHSVRYFIREAYIIVAKRLNIRNFDFNLTAGFRGAEDTVQNSLIVDDLTGGNGSFAAV